MDAPSECPTRIGRSIESAAGSNAWRRSAESLWCAAVSIRQDPCASQIQRHGSISNGVAGLFRPFAAVSPESFHASARCPFCPSAINGTIAVLFSRRPRWHHECRIALRRDICFICPRPCNLIRHQACELHVFRGFAMPQHGEAVAKMQRNRRVIRL